MKWFWWLGILVTGVLVEQWLGGWLTIQGVVLPISWWLLLLVCMRQPVQYWIWFGLGVGVAYDVVGLLSWGQYSVYFVVLTAIMSRLLQPKMDDGEGHRWRWMVGILTVGLVGLMVYEAVWTGIIADWGWEWFLYVGCRAALFVAGAAVIGWLSRPKKRVVNW